MRVRVTLRKQLARQKSFDFKNVLYDILIVVCYTMQNI